MISAKSEGASWEEAATIGAISSVATYMSISNLAGRNLPEAVTLVNNVAMDLTFGTGYSILSEAISVSILNNNDPHAIGNNHSTNNTRIRSGAVYLGNSKHQRPNSFYQLY